MTEHWKKKPRKTISIYKNQDFYEIQIIAIGMLGVCDPSIPSIFCMIDIVDTELGYCVRQALSKSRMLDMAEFQKIWSQQDILKQKGEEKNKLLIGKYGYKSKRELDLVIKSDNHPLNTLVIRRLKIDRADPAVS